MDLEEFNSRAAGDTGSLVGLLLKRGQQSLEPLEGTSVLANPDELNTTKTSRRVGRVAQMPDVLENRSPRSYTNTSTDEDSNFVLKNILSRGTVRSINAEARHLLAVLQSDFVHAHGVDTIVELRLSRASTECVTESAGEVTNLTHVNRDVGVEWARGDGKGVPLVLGDRGHLKEEPLTSLILERGLVELNLDDIVRVADDTGDLGFAAGADLTPETFNEIETTSPQLPSPAQVTDAVGPVIVSCERREALGSVTDEAADSVGVQSEEKRDKEMVSVPEGLERLLTDTRVRSCVHEEHAQKHDVSSDTTSLRIVDLKSADRTNLSLLDVVEVDVMG